MRMLEVSNGLPRKMDDLRSFSPNPMAVLPTSLKDLFSVLNELFWPESLGLSLASGGSSCWLESTWKGLSVYGICFGCLC